LPVVAGALVSLIFAALLAWYFAKPIRSLRSAFNAAADGRLEQGLVSEMGGRRDELADLGRDFDRMTAHLKRLMDSQRRLLHDVSHELRSPLARLQAAIGLLHQQPERSGDLLSRIERESMRMDHLVAQLLTLSRVEAGMAGRLDERVDLGELLSNVTEDASFEAEARDCQVCFNVCDTACIKGNAELLHRAFENVVRNAVKHSPNGATIHVDLGLDADYKVVCVNVSDQGKGVAEADLASIFEPFFRGQSNHSADSHGLGLAIAQRVVVAHGGQITAQNIEHEHERATAGFLVSIRLPLSVID
jgi:signal transduction histidine kinase